MKTVLISLISLVLILLAGESVRACSCSSPPSVEQSFEQSDAVFVGKVEDVSGSDKSINARFKVEKSWKGVKTDETLVYTDATSCGIDFRAGESYYLFAAKEANSPNVYRTVPCRRHAGTQEAFLQNKPVIQLKPGSLQGSHLLVNALVVTGVIILLIIFAVAAIFTYKSRKQNGLKKD